MINNLRGEPGVDRCFGREPSAGIRVGIIARKIRARDLQSDRVSCLEAHGCSTERDAIAMDVTGDKRLRVRKRLAIARPQDSVADVDCRAIGMDIDELRGPIGVRCIAGGSAPCAAGSDHWRCRIE
jgi:hypothetical protein